MKQMERHYIENLKTGNTFIIELEKGKPFPYHQEWGQLERRIPKSQVSPEDLQGKEIQVDDGVEVVIFPKTFKVTTTYITQELIDRQVAAAKRNTRRGNARKDVKDFKGLSRAKKDQLLEGLLKDFYGEEV